MTGPTAQTGELKAVRRRLAAPVWWLCGALDWVPGWTHEGGWLTHGSWGCWPFRVSRLAQKIEGDSR